MWEFMVFYITEKHNSTQKCWAPWNTLWALCFVHKREVNKNYKYNWLHEEWGYILALWWHLGWAQSEMRATERKVNMPTWQWVDLAWDEQVWGYLPHGISNKKKRWEVGPLPPPDTKLRGLPSITLEEKTNIK